MSKKRKNIDMLDEMLRVFILEGGRVSPPGNELIDNIAEFVFTTPVKFTPSVEKSEIILHQLRRALEETRTFGELLSSQIQQKGIDAVDLAKSTQLPQNVIDRLTRDLLFPIRVPVLLMKRMITHLKIPPEQAITALQNTARHIVNSVVMTHESAALASVPARRMANKTTRESVGIDETENFTNPNAAQASLNIYLQRLETIFKDFSFNG